MIKLTIEDLQEIADFKVIEKPLIQKPLIAESDVVTIDNNLSTYVTGTQKRELTVNLGYLDREGYEILRGFRDRQYENLKYPKASIIADIDIAPDGQIIESDITKSFNLTTNDNPLGVKSVELVKIDDNEDYIFEDNGRFYVHKATAKIASYNGETITTDYISTTGGLTTGATVYYVLATPVEYEITKDTLVELRYARTYVGQTNVWTESNGYDLPVKLDYYYRKDGAYLPVQITDSTYANLTDTLDAPLDITKLGGDTFQQTYTGKNLVNWAAYGNNGGATITVDGDGYFSVKATSTTSNYINISTRPSISLPAGTYTFSLSSATTEEIRLAGTYEGEGRGAIASIAAGGTSTTFTTTKTMVEADVWLPTSTGSAVDIKIRPMLEKGSTPTSFEPYVGGVPAPNPDYPQNVKVVAGENTVRVCGKNFLSDSLTGSINWSGTRADYYGDEIKISKTGTGAISANPHTATQYTPLKQGEAYTFSMKYRSGEIVLYGNYTWYFYVFGVRPDGTTSSAVGNRWQLAIPNNSATPERVSVSFTPSTDFIGFRLGCYIASSTPKTNGDVYFDCQLEKNSEVTDFEPYLGKDFEVNLGKNLFDKDNANVLNAYFALPSDTTITSNAQNRTLYVPCDANTAYTFQAMGSNWIRQVGYTATTPAEGVSVSGITNLEKNATSITITTNSTAQYLVFRFWHQRNSTETYQQALDSIQIEKGSTATSYASYFTPIELCKIGDYQDYIYKSDGKWWLHKIIQNYTITGDETIQIYQNNVADLVNLFTPAPFIPQGGGICNRAIYNPVQVSVSTTITYGEFALQQSGSQNNFFLKLPGSSYSTEAAQDWFKSNQTTIYYPLGTPTETELTNEDLVSQLEDLWSTYGFSEYTTIATSADDTGNAKPVLEATQGDITGKGTDYTLEETKKMPMEYKVYGQAVQNGTPSTSTPIPIETVKGNNSITFTGPSGRKEYSIVGKMTLADQRIIDNCGTAEQVQIVFRESKQI